MGVSEEKQSRNGIKRTYYVHTPFYILSAHYTQPDTYPEQGSTSAWAYRSSEGRFTLSRLLFSPCQRERSRSAIANAKHFLPPHSLPRQHYVYVCCHCYTPQRLRAHALIVMPVPRLAKMLLCKSEPHLVPPVSFHDRMRSYSKIYATLLSRTPSLRADEAWVGVFLPAVLAGVAVPLVLATELHLRWPMA